MKFNLKGSIKILNIDKNILSLCLYFILIICLFISFFFSISKTKSSILIPYTNTEEAYEYEETANVGTFITDTNEDINTKVLSYLNDFFSTRNESFLTGNVENLYKFYDLSHSYSKYSLHHEFKRIAYLRDWANERGIAFEKITSTPSIKNIEVKDNIISLSVDESFDVTYYYKENFTVKNNFTIKLFHTQEIQIIGNGLLLQKDYYFDSFENALKKYNFTLTEKKLPLTSQKTYNINFNRSSLNFDDTTNYNRRAAITYADKYCGVDNNNDSLEYNSNYFNASSLSYGGNSTNFVSQCLGDSNLGGSLPQDNNWFYDLSNTKSPKVSGAWLNPRDLKEYLTSNSKGFLMENNDFKTLVSKSSKSNSPFLNLQIGDLIFYTKGNFPIYSSIITGFDTNGYPLVNSNTVNRQHVPFDLGWSDNDITFQLIGIK